MRSIPAWAGEPFYARLRGKMAAVYPRVWAGEPLRRARVNANAGVYPRVGGGTR